MRAITPRLTLTWEEIDSKIGLLDRVTADALAWMVTNEIVAPFAGW